MCSLAFHECGVVLVAEIATVAIAHSSVAARLSHVQSKGRTTDGRTIPVGCVVLKPRWVLAQAARRPGPNYEFTEDLSTTPSLN